MLKVSITIRYTQHECIGGVLIELITTIIFTGWVKIKKLSWSYFYGKVHVTLSEKMQAFSFIFSSIYSKLEAFIPNCFDPPQHIWLLRWNMRNISQLKKTWMIFVFCRDLLNLGRYECLQFNGTIIRFSHKVSTISDFSRGKIFEKTSGRLR